MKSVRRVVAVSAATVLAVPALALSGFAVAQAAQDSRADVDKTGVCGTGDYEFGVEKDDGRFEVEAGLDHLPAGQKWRITLKQNGKTYTNVVRTTDREGEIDLDRNRRDTSGKDVFTFRAKRVGATGSCSATLTR